MAYSKLISIFFITLVLFSCAGEKKESTEQETPLVEEAIIQPDIKGNAYVISREENSEEDVIAEFDLINESLGKYFIVHYDPALHKESQAILAHKPLEKSSFEDGDYIIVQHNVNDYAKWEEKFLIFEATRAGMNIEVISVLSQYTNPNDVMIVAYYSDFQMVTEYGKMISSSKAMEDAGVVSDPKILLLTK